MKRRIKKVAVIGSEIIGSGIACHFANIGAEVLLLDIVPNQLTDVEQKNGLTLENNAVRNRIVNDNLVAASKSKSKSIYDTKIADRLRPGNTTDNLAKIKRVDWLI